VAEIPAKKPKRVGGKKGLPEESVVKFWPIRPKWQKRDRRLQLQAALTFLLNWPNFFHNWPNFTDVLGGKQFQPLATLLFIHHICRILELEGLHKIRQKPQEFY
jgi:hypothetical protein